MPSAQTQQRPTPPPPPVKKWEAATDARKQWAELFSKEVKK